MKILFPLLFLVFSNLAAANAERNKSPPSTYLAQKPGAPRVCIREETLEFEEKENKNIADSETPSDEDPLIAEEETKIL